MKKEQIGYDALLEEMLSRGKLPPEIEAEVRRALADGSQLPLWHAAVRALQAISEDGSLTRIDAADGNGVVRFVDLSRARVITVTPPLVPVKDYTMRVGPRIPDDANVRERLLNTDALLTAVAASQSETELGRALENIQRFVREVLPKHWFALNRSASPAPSPTPGPDSPAALPPGDPIETDARPFSCAIRDKTELASYVRRHVLDLGRALYFPDVADEPHLANQLIDPTLRSGAIIPLAAEGEVFGFLEAWHPAPRSLTDDDLGLLALLGRLAGGLVKNARRLERLIFVDPLTEVHTRGYFDEEFRREIERSNRSGSSLALLMIDLDHFKKVNDTYLHTTGDQALRGVAQLLKSHVRQIDIVTRYGGEEFAVLLPGASVEEATRAAERLRSKTETTRFAIDDSLALRLTLSIGVALYPEHAKSREELLVHGDEALYEAKDEGRNRVVVWHPGLTGRGRRS